MHTAHSSPLPERRGAGSRTALTSGGSTASVGRPVPGAATRSSSLARLSGSLPSTSSRTSTIYLRFRTPCSARWTRPWPVPATTVNRAQPARRLFKQLPGQQLQQLRAVAPVVPIQGHIYMTTGDQFAQLPRRQGLPRLQCRHHAPAQTRAYHSHETLGRGAQVVGKIDREPGKGQEAMLQLIIGSEYYRRGLRQCPGGHALGKVPTNETITGD